MIIHRVNRADPQTREGSTGYYSLASFAYEEIDHDRFKILKAPYGKDVGSVLGPEAFMKVLAFNIEYDKKVVREKCAGRRLLKDLNTPV
jgi:hypothetical protein